MIMINPIHLATIIILTIIAISATIVIIPNLF